MPDIVLPDGSPATVPYEDLDQAIAAGATPAGQELSALETAGAAAAGALRNIPYADSMLAEAVGGPREEALAGIRGLAEAAPTATTVGNLAGLVGGIAATGGASAIGEAAGAGAATALGGGTAARIAGQAVGMGLTGAIEQTVIGTAQRASEEVLGDPDHVGEKVAAGAMGDILMGGGLGAALGLVGGGIGEAIGTAGRSLATRSASTVEREVAAVGAKDLEKVAEKTFGYAPEGIGEKLGEWYRKGASALSGKDESVIGKLTAMTPEGKAARRLVAFEADETMDAAARSFRSSLDEALTGAAKVEDRFKGGFKREFVESAIPTTNHKAMTELVAARSEQVLNDAERLLQLPELPAKAAKTIEDVSTRVYDIKSQISAAIAEGRQPGVDAFMGLDELKRDLDFYFKGSESSLRSGSVAGVSGKSLRKVAPWYKATADALRADLENVELWGRAAEVQKAINAPWSKSIGAGQDALPSLTTQFGRQAGSYERATVADPGKIDTYLRNLTNPNKDMTHQAMRDWLDSKEQLMNAAKEALDLPPGEAEKALGGIAKMRETLKQAERDITTINQYKQLTSGGGDGVATLMGMVGLGVGGPLGGIAGGIMGTVANPGRAVAQLAAVERMGMKFDQAVGGGIKAFFDTAKTAEATARVPLEKTAALAKQLRQLSPANLVDAAAKSVGRIGEAAPKVANASALAITRAVSYLTSMAPAERPPVSMSPGIPANTDPPPQELIRFARRVEVVKDPASVIKHMKAGTLEREHTETLKTVYPALFEQMRAEVLERASEQKAPLTIQQMTAMAMLWDAPVHAMFEPAQVKAFQALHERKKAEEAAQQGGGRPASRKVAVNSSRLASSTEPEKEV